MGTVGGPPGPRTSLSAEQRAEAGTSVIVNQGQSERTCRLWRLAIPIFL